MRRIDLKKASVARSDTIRNINRQIVLNYVRERSPISRAAISQETELQRSTISLIVDELMDQGLIEELEGESTGGRPPLLLQLRAAGAVALGVDIGTKATLYRLLSELAGQGTAIIVVSSDMEEVLTIADRIIVMANGRITGTFTRAEVTQDKILTAASGE